MPQFIPGRLRVRSNQIDLGSNIDLIALPTDTWENFSQFDIQLPNAGLYLITSQFSSSIRVGSITDTLWITSRVVLRDGGDSFDFPTGYRLINYVQFPVVSELYYNVSNGTFLYEATGADLLSVDFLVHGSQINNVQIISGGSFGGSFISYYQVGL